MKILAIDLDKFNLVAGFFARLSASPQLAGQLAQDLVQDTTVTRGKRLCSSTDSLTFVKKWQGWHKICLQEAERYVEISLTATNRG